MKRPEPREAVLLDALALMREHIALVTTAYGVAPAAFLTKRTEDILAALAVDPALMFDLLERAFRRYAAALEAHGDLAVAERFRQHEKKLAFWAASAKLAEKLKTEEASS